MDPNAQNPQKPFLPAQEQPVNPIPPSSRVGPQINPEPTAPTFPSSQPQQSNSLPPMTPIEPQQIPPEEPPVMHHGSKILPILLGLIVIGLIGAGVLFFLSGNKEKAVQQTATPTLAVIKSPTPTTDPTLAWKTYEDKTNNFSLKYPPTVTLEDEKTLGNRPNEDYIVIANQIEVRVTELDPFKCTGECTIVEEKNEKITIANLPATRVSGTVKAIGGNVAQSIDRVVFQNGKKYYIFDLYELERKLTTPAPTNRTPGKIAADKVLLLNQILPTFTLTQVSSPTSPAASTSCTAQ